MVESPIEDCPVPDCGESIISCFNTVPPGYTEHPTRIRFKLKCEDWHTVLMAFDMGGMDEPMYLLERTELVKLQ